MNDGELARKLRAAGVPVTIFDESRNGAFAIFQGLRRHFVRLRPDVIHTHRQKENVLGSMANSLSIRVPSVRTSHGSPEHRPKGLNNLHKLAFYAADHLCGTLLQSKIIAVSRPLADELSQHYSSKKINVVENGVDASTLQSTAPAADILAEHDQRNIGFVGRLQPVKRVDLFLRMAHSLLQQEPNLQWRFHVIGDGPLRTSLESSAKQLGVADRVRFHGHRSDSTSCLAALDALVMCSDHEGMPMTPLEAICVGTPVVGHAVGGLNDLLAGQTGGLLVQDHSPAGYADAVLKLFQMDRVPLIRRGRERVEQRFSANHNAAQVAAIYRDLTDSRRINR
jgi:glycosyltransferase involved in cell wall biosynthesis